MKNLVKYNFYRYVNSGKIIINYKNDDFKKEEWIRNIFKIMNILFVFIFIFRWDK